VLADKGGVDRALAVITFEEGIQPLLELSVGHKEIRS
jgi:hypothetical protein